MTGLHDDLLTAVRGMFLWFPLIYVTYLVAAAWRGGPGPRRGESHWRRRVTFHAWWGVVLSLPGVTVALAGGLGDQWSWVGVPALIATVACWVLALSASAGRRVPNWLAWAPLLVLLVSIHGFAAGFATQSLAPDYTWTGLYLEAWIFTTDLGLGLAAWLMVTISFALSVRHVNACAAQRKAHPVAEPGFVWPT